jgi:hypothetical protein
MIEAVLIGDMKRGFLMYKTMCDKAIAQVDDSKLFWKPDAESNSIAVLMRHIGGNLASRWRDYLSTDGEKPDRDRDSEFEENGEDRSAHLARWERGWAVLFSALEGLTADTLMKAITIRKQPLTVIEALNRSLTHTAYHAGQIVYAAKAIRSSEWKTLSIPRGKSREFTP